MVVGARAVAEQALAFAQFAPLARPALVNGVAELVVGSRVRPISVIGFSVVGDSITEIDILTDPPRLGRLNLGVLDD